MKVRCPAMSNVYELVTERILALLEQGQIPWHKPWAAVNGGAFNRVTGRRYSLLNQMMLSHAGEYASLAQWNRLGGSVKKGSKSEIVVFFKQEEEDKEELEPAEEKDDRKKSRFILKYYRVFHISQVEGVEPLPRPELECNFNPIAEAERVLHDYLDLEGVQFEQGLSDKAFYRPSDDSIHVPAMSQFGKIADYYSTLFHECVHSTGHASRLHRPGIQHVNFGSETYSKEELVAELGASCLLQSLGISTEDSIRNSAGYVQGWLDVLRSDKRMVVFAASAAEKACKFILDCSKFPKESMTVN